MAVLGLVWLLCLGAMLGCSVAVFVFSEVTIQVWTGAREGCVSVTGICLVAAGPPSLRPGCSPSFPALPCSLLGHPLPLPVCVN